MLSSHSCLLGRKKKPGRQTIVKKEQPEAFSVDPTLVYVREKDAILPSSHGDWPPPTEPPIFLHLGRRPQECSRPASI